jgi:hypothetical protein
VTARRQENRKRKPAQEQGIASSVAPQVSDVRRKTNGLPVKNGLSFNE